MIDLATGVIAMKIVVIESLIVKAVDIDQNDIHREITLIKQGIKEYKPNLECQ